MSLKSLVHESKDVGRLISSKFTSSISFFSQAEKSSRDNRSCLKRTDITMGESLCCKTWLSSWLLTNIMFAKKSSSVISGRCRVGLQEKWKLRELTVLWVDGPCAWLIWEFQRCSWTPSDENRKHERMIFKLITDQMEVHFLRKMIHYQFLKKFNI